MTQRTDDPGARAASEKREKEELKEQKKDLQQLLALPAFRRLSWRLLVHCSVHSSIFSQDTALMAYRSGKQDVGHFLEAELVKADEDKFNLMRNEAALSKTIQTKENEDA